MSAINAAEAANAAANITLLTFGMLSSCLTLPILPDTLTNMTSSSQISALAVTQSCAYGPGFMAPKYDRHLAAVRAFATQLNTILAKNATQITVPTTVPSTLPLWLGLGLFVLILFQFTLVVLFIVSEAPSLLPSPTNSGAAETAPGTAVGPEVLETSSLTRYALKLQRVMTPLLMPATMLLIALSIVLNTKFPTMTSTVGTVLVMTKTSGLASNTAKLWLCVLAEGTIWFISRRRLVRRTALEDATRAIWEQITASGYILQSAPASAEKTLQQGETVIEVPAPIYAPKPPATTAFPQSTADDLSLSWRLVGDTSGKLYN